MFSKTDSLTIRISGGTGVLIASLWLMFEYSLLGSASVIISADNSELVVPGFLSPGFAGVDNPLWDNFTAAGVDRKVNGHMAWLDIFLFNHLPGWLAHGVRIASQVILAVLSVYLLCRRTLKFGPGAAVFVAFSFGAGLNPYLMQSAAAYTPLILLCLTLVLERKSDFRWWILLAVSVFVISHTSYFSRLVPNVSVMLVVWFLFIDTKKTLPDWLIIFGTGLAVVALRFEDIQAMMAFSSESHIALLRGPPDLESVVRDTFWPSMFFGSPNSMILSGLFLYALIVSRFGKPHIKGMLIFLLLGGLILPPTITALQLALMETLPFLRGYSLIYLAALPRTLLLFAGGFGVQVLIEQIQKPEVRKTARLFGWGAIILCAGFPFYDSVKSKYTSVLNWVTHGTYVRNFESPVLRNLAATIQEKPWPERAESFQMYPAYLHAYGIETTGGYVPLYYRRYYEFWGTLSEPRMSKLRPETQDYSRFSNIRQKAGGWLKFRGARLMLMPEDYRSEWQLGDLFNLNLLSLANVGYLVSRDRLVDKSLTPIREAKAPWSSLSHRERTKINLKANFNGLEELYIYKNRNVFPRFFSVPALKAFDTGRNVLDALAKASADDLRNAAFVEKGVLPKELSTDRRYGNALIKLIRYTSDEIKLAVQGDDETILIVTNTYSPFWKADVNGTETPMFPAYHAFWGIHLPPGSNTVTFRFSPPYR